MTPGSPIEQDPETRPVCPQCGSEETALIPQPPAPPAAAAQHPKARDLPLYRCLTCRYKWKEGEED